VPCLKGVVVDARLMRLVVWCAALIVVSFGWSGTASAAPTTSRTAAATSTTVVATATASASATPNTGLSDLEIVTVAGSGFIPNHELNVAQCNLFNGGAGGVCYGPTRKSEMSDSGGAFTTSFIVRRVIVETSSSVDCASASDTCGIVVQDVTNTAVATLAFDSAVPANLPKITMTPGTGLHNGDTLQIAGSGFTPNEHVTIAQCATGTIGLEHCDTSNEATAVTDDKGSFATTSFVVHASITIAGTSGGPLDCLPTTTDVAPCALVAANAGGPSEFAAMPLTFEAPTTLPRTGSTSFPLAGIALVSIAAGAALIFGVRRRSGSAIAKSPR